MKYEVWTRRALAVWVPICILLAFGPPAASILLTAWGYSIPWHIHVVNSLAPLAVMYIVYRRIELHTRYRDSIDHYLSTGTRVVVEGGRLLNALELDALERGLRKARWQCQDKFNSARIENAHSKAFLVIKDEVLVHREGKSVRVGGLTYHGGPMVIEHTRDLALLEDRARHEGCHYVLNYLGVADLTGDIHHQRYPELFK